MIQEVVAIIDRSGSMYGKEVDTIGGINTTIEELKKNKNEDESIKFSLKLFDNEEYLKIRSKNIEDIYTLTKEDLKPRGQTALLDAMGTTLTFFINKKIVNPNSFDSCIIYVTTDGLENCSHKYNNDMIKNLIQHGSTIGIQVLYLGANQDSILEAKKFGLNHENAMNYSETAQNTQEAYRSIGNAAKRVRTGVSIGFSENERARSER